MWILYLNLNSHWFLIIQIIIQQFFQIIFYHVKGLHYHEIVPLLKS